MSTISAMFAFALLYVLYKTVPIRQPLAANVFRRPSTAAFSLKAAPHRLHLERRVRFSYSKGLCGKNPPCGGRPGGLLNETCEDCGGPLIERDLPDSTV